MTIQHPLERLILLQEDISFIDKESNWQNRKNIFITKLTFLFVFPIVSAPYLWSQIVRVFSKVKASQREMKALRFFFKTYFMFWSLPFRKSVESELPDPNTQCLIFFVKESYFSSTYIWHALNIPLLIPIKKALYQFRACPWLPFTFPGKLLKKTSYPEADLTANWANITACLDAGYSVAIDVNPGYVDHRTTVKLPVYQKAAELIQKSELPVYLVRTAGFNKFGQTSVKTAYMTRLQCWTKAKAFEGVDMTNLDAIGTRIAVYFGCQDKEWH